MAARDGAASAAVQRSHAAAKAPPINTDGVKRAHRYRPGTVAQSEIWKYQNSTEILIPKVPFQRLVKEVAQDYRTDLQFQFTAIEAMQEASEEYLTGIMADGLTCMLHGERKTMMLKDMVLAGRIGGPDCV